MATRKTGKRAQVITLPSPLNVRVTLSTRARIDRLADRDQVGIGEIVRRALEQGLPLLEVPQKRDPGER